MKKVVIKDVAEIKLNSFRPLCWTELGKRAVATYKHPPFIDASCRREPDFENPFPSISALCRQGKFAPHLKVNDVVVYMTVAGKYAPFDERHHRLIAILQVTKIYDTHQHGQLGYAKDKQPIPSNCMVENNRCFRFDQTAGNFETKSEIKKFMSRSGEQQELIGERRLQHWDQRYLEKSITWPCFVRTKPLYVNIINPVAIFRSDFETIFNKVPNTRTPNKISKEQLALLGGICGVKILYK